MQTDRLVQQLEKYELNEKEANVWLYLLKQGVELSVVDIAHGLELGRTPVYNALDRLEAKGLVKHIISPVGFRFAALEPHNLRRYWDDLTEDMHRKAGGLKPIIESLEQLGAASGYKSRVAYFTGKRGLEQITYNSLKANGDLYIYEVATDMTEFIDPIAAEKYRQVLASRGITTHQLTNHEHFKPFTKVKKMITDFWDIRHIAPEVLDIKFEMLIYDDTVALYSNDGDELFGVEIINPNLAEMQKQMFKAMQHLAKPLKKLDNFGRASL